MLSRNKKALFYFLAGPLMKLNGWLYYFLKAPHLSIFKVHLGPGKRTYLEGWINLDANMFTGRCDVWVDLRNRLPFRDDTISAIYSHHVIEHLPNLDFHFQEVYRCLKPGGVYRVGGPNGDSAIKKFVEGDKEWFNDYPDSRKSLGGKLDNFIFCRQEHLAILTYSYLDELIRSSGFTKTHFCMPTEETNYPDVFSECLATEFEYDFNDPHTIIVECEKPA